MNHTAGQQRYQTLADRRSGLHHAGGDASGEVVLEERPRLPHHVPMVLPAMRLETLAAMPWFITRCWVVKASGRSTSSSTGHAEHSIAALRPDVVRRGVGDQRDHFADEDRMVTSSSATTSPIANRPANSPFAWLAKCHRTPAARRRHRLLRICVVFSDFSNRRYIGFQCGPSATPEASRAADFQGCRIARPLEPSVSWSRGRPWHGGQTPAGGSARPPPGASRSGTGNPRPRCRAAAGDRVPPRTSSRRPGCSRTWRRNARRRAFAVE